MRLCSEKFENIQHYFKIIILIISKSAKTWMILAELLDPFFYQEIKINRLVNNSLDCTIFLWKNKKYIDFKNIRFQKSATYICLHNVDF